MSTIKKSKALGNRSQRDPYSMAKDECCHGCIFNSESQRYIISNDLWKHNQDKHFKILDNLTTQERKATIRKKLEQALSQCGTEIETSKTRINLFFKVKMYNPDTTNGNYCIKDLCESCYVHFENSCCKFLYYFSYFVISF